MKSAISVLKSLSVMILSGCYPLQHAASENNNVSPTGPERISGRFSVEVISEYPLSFRIREEISYTDPDGIKWTVPKGTQLEGKIFPHVLWDMNGGPLVEPHRIPFTIYEYYSTRMLAPLEDTRSMLAHAMNYRGAAEEKWPFYRAVVAGFGPRWRLEKSENGNISGVLDSPLIDKEGDPAFLGYLLKAWLLSDRNSNESRRLISIMDSKGRISEKIRERHIELFLQDEMNHAIDSARKLASPR